MPRIPSKKVAATVAQRLRDRGNSASMEWLTAWCMRWGSLVAKDTAANILVIHNRTQNDEGETFMLIGTDRVPEQTYREWRHFQNLGSTVYGSPEGQVTVVD